VTTNELEEKRHKLAEAVVKAMSLDDLISYVYEDLINLYKYNQESFELAWDNFFGEDR
jgi:predicted O-methyltransferase YrrM